MKNFKPFFDTIAQTMIFDEKQFERLKRLGVDVSLWPKTTQAAPLLRFIEKLNEGYWVARQHVLGGSLEGFEEMVHLPETDAEFQELYFKNINSARSVELGSALLVSPENASKLLQEYQERLVSKATMLEEKSLAAEHLKILEKRNSLVNPLAVIPGFERLSDLIGGFNPERVTIVSALTGFGKTNLALNLAANASNKMVVGMINMEMGLIDLQDRLFAIKSKHSHNQVRTGKIDWTKAIAMYSEERTQRLFITDGKNLSLDQIYSEAYQLKQNKNLHLLFIDYDQKIDLRVDSKTPEWKALQLAVQAIEAMAKELKIHIVMLSQAADEGAPSGSKRSMYPASTVLYFTKVQKDEEEIFILKPIKNRFGPTNKSIEVEYIPEMSIIKEKGYYEPPKLGTGPIKFKNTKSGILKF